jgi:hypothetical protein
MEQYFSITDPNLLTHIVFRFSEFKGRLNIVNPKEYLQVAALLLQDGESFKPHIHVWKDVNIDMSVAQEAWVILEGSVHVQMLDSESNFVGKTILNIGDCCITLNGGHEYRSIGQSKVYEFKSGPYLGDKLDKFYV